MLRKSLPLVSAFTVMVTLGLADGAAGLSITVAGPSSGPLGAGTGSEPAVPGDELTFTVGLDAATSINGYDLTISWDPSELSFSSALELSGLGFDVAPVGSSPAGERVAAISLTAASSTALFQVTFGVVAVVPDGLSDFAVFVDPQANGSGIAPGSLSLENPGGAGLDVVPEPDSGILLGSALALLWAARRAAYAPRAPP